MYFTSSFQPRIPSDVLIGILESLYTIAPTTLRGLRVVSKQFDALIVPFAYRHVVLNKKILAWFSVRFGGMVVNGRHPTWVEWHGLRDMRRYTEHVTIDRDLNEVATIYLLRSLRRLEYITWSYWGSVDARLDSYHGPLDLQDDIQDRWPNVQFLVEGFNAHLSALANIDCIPRSNLISCKTDAWANDADTLQELLLSRPQLPQLETLHLDGGRHFVGIADTLLFSEDRLPPVKELALQRYRWTHSPHVAVTFWNWTGMTSLELRRVNITCFLRTVTPENLIQLRRFSTDGYCQPWEENEASSLICTLVAEIKALERLALVCQFDTDGLLAAITKHGPSLRSLALRDFDGTNARWPHMDSFLSRDNLWAIRSACPNLTDLETNIEIQLPANFVVVGPLTRFRNLRRLTLFTCMPEPFTGSEDRETLLRKTRNAARSWIVGLVGVKLGAIFEKVVMNVGVEKAATGGEEASWGAFVRYKFEGEKDANGLVIQEEITEEG